MINADQIASALNLTNVILFEDNGRASITADQLVTDDIQVKVQAWYDAGALNAPRTQSGATVIRRLTDAEIVALDASKHPAAIRAKMIAQSEGVISEADQDFAALTGALDQLGIIAANRWEILLAP
jgi:hypothetical protein